MWPPSTPTSATGAPNLRGEGPPTHRESSDNEEVAGLKTPGLTKALICHFRLFAKQKPEVV